MQTSKDRNTRFLAGFAAAFLVLVALAMWFTASVMAQEGWDDYNGLQLAVGGLAAVGLLASGVFSLRYATGGGSGRSVAISLLVAASLIGVWFLGQVTWCSHCGAP